MDSSYLKDGQVGTYLSVLCCMVNIVWVTDGYVDMYLMIYQSGKQFFAENGNYVYTYF